MSRDDGSGEGDTVVLPHPAQDLSADDDILSWALVDQLGALPGTKLGVYPQEIDFVGAFFDTEETTRAIKEMISMGDRHIPNTVDQLARFHLFRAHMDNKLADSQRHNFLKHLRRYLLPLLPASRVEIHTTPRYTAVTKHIELAVYATRPLAPGVVLDELQGSVVDLPEEWKQDMEGSDEPMVRNVRADSPVDSEAEDEEAEDGDEDEDEADRQTLKSRRASVKGKGKATEGAVNESPQSVKSIKQRRRDFSMIYSRLKKCVQLFLGPARFVNHDCAPNVELKREGRHVTYRVIRPIKIGEELLACYGEDYFGQGNCECLCLTCETLQRGGFANGLQALMGSPTPFSPSISNDPAISVGSPNRITQEQTLQVEMELSGGPSTPGPSRTSVSTTIATPTASHDMQVDSPAASIAATDDVSVDLDEDEDGLRKARPKRAAAKNVSVWAYVKKRPKEKVLKNDAVKHPRTAPDDLMPTDFPRCTTCAKPLHEKISYKSRTFEHCSRCIRHSLIFDLPWPAHRKQDVLEYPPSHLIPANYVPRRITSVPIPSLSEAPIQVEVSSSRMLERSRMSVGMRATADYRLAIEIEEYEVEQLRADAWAKQLSEIEAAQAMAEEAERKRLAREAARQSRLEKKRQRDAGKIKGSGVWSRYEILTDEEWAEREAAKNAITSGTRRGGRYKATDEEEERAVLEAARQKQQRKRASITAAALREKERKKAKRQHSSDDEDASGNPEHEDQEASNSAMDIDAPSAGSSTSPRQAGPSARSQIRSAPKIPTGAIELDDEDADENADSDDDIIFLHQVRAPSVQPLDKFPMGTMSLRRSNRGSTQSGSQGTKDTQPKEEPSPTKPNEQQPLPEPDTAPQASTTVAAGPSRQFPSSATGSRRSSRTAVPRNGITSLRHSAPVSPITRRALESAIVINSSESEAPTSEDGSQPKRRRGRPPGTGRLQRLKAEQEAAKKMSESENSVGKNRSKKSPTLETSHPPTNDAKLKTGASDPTSPDKSSVMSLTRQKVTEQTSGSGRDDGSDLDAPSIPRSTFGNIIGRSPGSTTIGAGSSTSAAAPTTSANGQRQSSAPYESTAETSKSLTPNSMAPMTTSPTNPSRDYLVTADATEHRTSPFTSSRTTSALLNDIDAATRFTAGTPYFGSFFGHNMFSKSAATRKDPAKTTVVASTKPASARDSLFLPSALTLAQRNALIQRKTVKDSATDSTSHSNVIPPQPRGPSTSRLRDPTQATAVAIPSSYSKRRTSGSVSPVKQVSTLPRDTSKAQAAPAHPNGSAPPTRRFDTSDTRGSGAAAGVSLSPPKDASHAAGPSRTPLGTDQHNSGKRAEVSLPTPSASREIPTANGSGLSASRVTSSAPNGAAPSMSRSSASDRTPIFNSGQVGAAGHQRQLPADAHNRLAGTWLPNARSPFSAMTSAKTADKTQNGTIDEKGTSVLRPTPNGTHITDSALEPPRTLQDWAKNTEIQRSERVEQRSGPSRSPVSSRDVPSSSKPNPVIPAKSNGFASYAMSGRQSLKIQTWRPSADRSNGKESEGHGAVDSREATAEVSSNGTRATGPHLSDSYRPFVAPVTAPSKTASSTITHRMPNSLSSPSLSSATATAASISEVRPVAAGEGPARQLQARAHSGRMPEELVASHHELKAALRAATVAFAKTSTPTAGSALNSSGVTDMPSRAIDERHFATVRKLSIPPPARNESGTRRSVQRVDHYQPSIGTTLMSGSEVDDESFDSSISPISRSLNGVKQVDSPRSRNRDRSRNSGRTGEMQSPSSGSMDDSAEVDSDLDVPPSPSSGLENSIDTSQRSFPLVKRRSLESFGQTSISTSYSPDNSHDEDESQSSPPATKSVNAVKPDNEPDRDESTPAPVKVAVLNSPLFTPPQRPRIVSYNQEYWMAIPEDWSQKAQEVWLDSINSRSSVQTVPASSATRTVWRKCPPFIMDRQTSRPMFATSFQLERQRNAHKADNNRHADSNGSATRSTLHSEPQTSNAKTQQQSSGSSTSTVTSLRTQTQTQAQAQLQATQSPLPQKRTNALFNTPYRESPKSREDRPLMAAPIGAVRRTLTPVDTYEGSQHLKRRKEWAAVEAEKKRRYIHS